ncbi:MAG: PAS domain S-box protein [Gammaproteobacteria bacterium]|nr:PAS domain S-box protein [Gammaproteobacteria bacterium]
MSQFKVNLADLRQRAEQAIEQSRARFLGLDAELAELNIDAAAGAAGVRRLLEELHIYQAELEIQNQQLIDSQTGVRRNLEKYRSLFAHLPLPTLLVDGRGIVSETNRAAQQLFGLSTQASLQHGAVALLFASQSRAALHGLLQPGQPGMARTGNLLQLKSADGEPRWVDAHAIDLPLEEAEAGCLLILLDRTAELELHESEDRFRNLADSAPVMIWISDHEQQMRWFNRGWREFTGHGPEQDVAGGWLSALHADDRPRFRQRLRQAYAEAEVFTTGMRLRRQDGVYRWVLISAQPRFGEPGELLGFTGVCVDFTERQELLDRLNKIADHVRGMIFQFQQWPDGRSAFPYVSLRIRNLSALEPEEVCPDASRVMQRIHPEDMQRISDSIVESAEHLSQWSEIYRVNLPDGRLLWLEGESSPERLADGSVLWHGYIRDITERRQAEERLNASQQLLQLVFDGVNDGVWDWDLKHNQVTFSANWKAQLGYSDAEFVNSFENFIAHMHPEDRPQFMRRLMDYLSGEDKIYQTEFRMRHKEGDWRWIMARGQCLRDASGKPYRMVGSHTEISARKAAEAQLQMAASVFSGAREGILITELQGHIIEVNQAFSDITGYSREEVLGQNPRILNSGHQSAEFFAGLWATLQDKGHWYGEIWNRRKDGEVYAELLTISAVRDAQGRPSHYVALFSDITLLKNQQKQLEHIAHYDALTGLPNRSLFSDRLNQAMANAQRRDQRIALVFIDLDGFKAVNDEHGHKTGDMLLRELAQRMKDSCREGDTVARIGGDEFVAVLLDLDDATATEPLLRRLLVAASQPVVTTTATASVQVSASIGVSFYPQAQPIAADQLMRQADQAMYQAKLSGKNRFHVFDQVEDSQLRGRLACVAQVHQGLQDGQFLLYYQPKVNMRSGKVFGAEALIRWQHPQRGLLSPGHFLGDIQEHPVGLEVDDWVLSEALRQLAQWQEQGLELTLSVNVSAQQLQQADFVAHLRDRLAQYPKLDARMLELEVLETSALSDLEQASEVIRQCLEIGVGFALDDFGSGYSSLTYLKRLPARVLKIDQGFVIDMLADADDIAIVDGLLGLATAFRRQAIAEGVESLEHGRLLLRLGCDLAQGYAIAHPMPAEQLHGWISAWRPDPQWSQVAALEQNRMPLVYAGVEHRSWVNALVAYLQGKRATAPTLDHQQCRFGEWLRGAVQQVESPAAQLLRERIEPLHQQIHQLAESLLTSHRNGDFDQVQAQLPELYRRRDELLEHLELMMG